MRIFISTGEVSGDLQGAILTEALRKRAAELDLDLEVLALGGDRMEQAGATLLGNTTGIGSIGLLEAVPFILPTIKLQNYAKQYLQKNPPDVVVLIDYAAPNIAIGNHVKKHLPQVPIVYYIAPQDWAVPKLGNAPKLVAFVDKLLAVFPQEAEYYQKRGIDVTWVGHPMLDKLEGKSDRNLARQQLGLTPEQPIVTLLPASRRQEIKKLLPIIAEAARIIQQQIPEIQFLIPLALPKYREAIQAAIIEYQIAATIIEKGNSNYDHYSAIAAADLAITKSGTVNLEIALLDTPQVVLYKVHPLTAWVGRKLLKIDVPLMSPVNLLLNQEITPELQQEAATPENVATQALEILKSQERSQAILQGYQEMRSRLGEIGVTTRAASEIINLAKA